MQINLREVVPGYIEKENIARSQIWGKNLSIEKGEHLHIVAPSGSGKTSLMHFIYGLRKDYTGIITKERKYCVLAALGNLLREDPFQRFIRIHRSYAVQKQFIRKLSSKTVMVEDISLPVGRSFKDAVEKLLSNQS